MHRKNEMPILPDIVERHAAEAAFLWARRDAAARAPHHDLGSLSELDEAIEAHVDGLRIAGGAGWEICSARVPQGDGGDLFVATILSVERADLRGLAAVLDAGGAKPVLSRGIASGLGWVSRARVERLLPGLLAHGAPPPLAWLGIAACAAHRLDPGPPLASALGSPDARLAARAARAAGELGRTDLSRALRELLRSEAAAVRFAAAWSLALLGDAQGPPVLLAFASEGGPLAERAVELAMRAPGPAAEWLEAHLAVPGSRRAAVIAAGATGDPRWVPQLLAWMEPADSARLAGAAFSLVTGVDLAREHLVARPPEGLALGPSDDPDDDDVAPDPDEHLPWPAAARVAELWDRARRSFVPGERYLLGQPVSRPGWLPRVLAEGSQRQRAAAAIEIALQSPGRPLFEVRAPGFQQREALGLAD